MIIDLNEWAGSTIGADVAVVGTGATGLALAMSFMEKGLSVAMLETGGYERTEEAEHLSRAEVQGSLPVWIQTRSRFLGGSTNCWGGNNSPLDPVDFERDWVPDATWPIGLDDLAPFAEQAHDLLRLGPTDFSLDFWKKRLKRVRDGLLFEHSDVVTTKLIQKTNVGHVGELMQRDLESSATLTVYLNAQVVNLDTRNDGSIVAGIDVVSLDGTRTARVEAAEYVLAAGPENARLLLASNRQDPRGIGNEYDQVGKWWLAHHSALRGWLEPAPGLDWEFYDTMPWPVGDRQVFACLQLTEEVQRREKLLNSAAILETYKPHTAFNNRARSIAAVKTRLGRHIESLEPQELTSELALGFAGDTARVLARTADEQTRRFRKKPVRAFVRNWCEQTPDPDNRVVLSDETDRFGVPKMRIISNLLPSDRHTLRRSFEIMGEEFEAQGYGRLVSDFPEGDDWPPGAISTAHFMGGTRMHVDPQQGVVDEECRVHGVDNLWVAGGSVFPTAGVSMVTYTAILLAFRAAERIASGASGAGRAPVSA